MQSPIKTGLLSFGMSGKVFHAPFINDDPNFELGAVVERSEKKAHLSYENITSYDSVDELLQDADIVMVVVNTPNATHFEYALKALNASKHVLVEKPFTITTLEAKELFRVAREMKKFIFPYQNRRYDSDFLVMKKVIDSGTLGNLIEVHFRFDRYRYEIGIKAKESGAPGSGILYDLGPHLIDQAIALFGIPSTWSKSIGKFRPDTKVDDYAHVHLEYLNGLQVFITASMLVVDPQPSFLIHGSKGTFSKHRADIQEKQLVDGMKPDHSYYSIEDIGLEARLTYFSDDGVKHSEVIHSGKTSYGKVYVDIYNTLHKGKTYPVNETDVLKQLEILEG